LLLLAIGVLAKHGTRKTRTATLSNTVQATGFVFGKAHFTIGTYNGAHAAPIRFAANRLVHAVLLTNAFASGLIEHAVLCITPRNGIAFPAANIILSALFFHGKTVALLS